MGIEAFGLRDIALSAVLLATAIGFWWKFRASEKGSLHFDLGIVPVYQPGDLIRGKLIIRAYGKLAGERVWVRLICDSEPTAPGPSRGFNDRQVLYDSSKLVVGSGIQVAAGADLELPFEIAIPGEINLMQVETHIQPPRHREPMMKGGMSLHRWRLEAGLECRGPDLSGGQLLQIKMKFV